MNKAKLFSALLLFSLPSLAFGSWIMNEKSKKDGIVFTPSTEKAVCYIESTSVKYTSLEKAISVASNTATSNNRETIIVIPNSIITLTNLTIPNYVTVFVPTTKTSDYKIVSNKNDSMYGFYPITDSESGAGFADASSPTTNRESILKIKKSCTINSNASLVVDAVLGTCGSGLSGHTSGKYSEIQLYPNATLSNHGTLDLRGYLKSVDANGEYKREDNGSRCYNLNGAKTYSPFVVDDYGGGSSTVGNYLAGNICPFNGFEMPNLQTTFFNNGKSELYGWADLYTSAMKNAVLDLPAKHNRCSPKVIGSSEAIINLNSNSILSVRYSPKYATSSGSQIKGTTVNDWGTGRTFDSSGNENPSGRYKMNITGGANSGSLNMLVSVGKGKVPISTKDVLFPVSWKYDISLNNGTYTFGTKIKFLPGSTLSAKNSTLAINSDCIFYNEGMDDKKDSGHFPYAKNQKASSFTLNNSENSSITGCSFGGFVNVSSQSSSLSISTDSLSVQTHEGIGGFTTDASTIIQKIGLTGSYEILEFLKGNKNYEDIVGDVKKLATYTETFSDTVYAKGYIGKAANADNFTAGNYTSPEGNSFWSKENVSELTSIVIDEKDKVYMSGKKKAQTFHLVLTSFEPADFDFSNIVKFEWKQQRQRTNVSEDGTFSDLAVNSCTFTTQANGNVVHDNKIDVWLVITIKGKADPIISNKVTLTARMYR